MPAYKPTREEFEEAYARRSGTTMKVLRNLGLQSAPCDCGEVGCEGWQMENIHAKKQLEEMKSDWRRDDF